MVNLFKHVHVLHIWSNALAKIFSTPFSQFSGFVPDNDISGHSIATGGINDVTHFNFITCIINWLSVDQYVVIFIFSSNISSHSRAVLCDILDDAAQVM